LDQAFTLSEVQKAQLRNQQEDWKELAPSEKLFQAAFSLGERKKVLDYLARSENVTALSPLRKPDREIIVRCLIRLLPVIVFPIWLYVWTGVIALIKGINIVSGVVMRKRFVAVHTVMNKITGALLFVLPLTIPLIEPRHGAIVVCAIATFAAIQEGHLIRSGDERIGH
jgi:hypothetical protein